MRLFAPLLLLSACRRPGEVSPSPLDTPNTGELAREPVEPPSLEADTWPAEDAGWSLLDEGQRNMMLVSDVAVDAAGRRGWAVGLASDTVAELDLDSGEVLGWTRLSGVPTDPELLADGAGVAWLLGGPGGAVVRLEGGDTEEIAGLGATTGVGLEEGGLVVAADGDRLLRLNPSGGIGLDVSVSGRPVAMTLLDGEVAVLLRDDDGTHAVSTYETTALHRTGTTASPIGGSRLARLADGRWFVNGGTDLAVVAPDGTALTDVWPAAKLRQAFPYGDGVVLLDVAGDASLDGVGYAAAWTLDGELAQPRPVLAAGRHSAQGAVDSETGLYWLNAEDSTAAVAWDPDAGEVVQTIRLGRHVESVTWDPAAPHRAWFTGRLSQETGRIDLLTGEVRLGRAVDGWPRAPLLVDDTLWVVEQWSGDLYALDPDTLEVLRHLDTGLEPTPEKTFDTLLWHAGRGTLFLGHCPADRLVEIDPATGETLQSWELAGEPTALADSHGVLELAGGDPWIWAFSSDTGGLTLVDPDRAEPLAELVLNEDALGRLRYSVAPLLLFRSSALLYVGNLAFDAETLAAASEHDLDLTRVVGERPDGRLVGWREEDGTVVQLQGGEVVDTVTLAPSLNGDPDPRLLDPAGGRLVYIQQDEAAIRTVPLAP